jgi:hypothetical protein
MTREEARKLLGGYAAGALTPAEQRALFEAALHDQELFDELAREQPLKEALDDPRLRAEALDALTADPRPRWIWAVAGAGALAVAAIAFVFIAKIDRQVAPPAEIAKTGEPPRIEPAPSVSAPPSQPTRGERPAVKIRPKQKPAAGNHARQENAVRNAVTAAAVESPPVAAIRLHPAPSAVTPMLARTHPFELRYSVQTANGFVAGMAPRIMVETNAPAHVYAFHRDSGGDWVPLTPGGLNLAEGIATQLPPPPPRANLLVIASRTPVPDLAASGGGLDSAIERLRAAAQPSRVMQVALDGWTSVVAPDAGPDARIVLTIPLARIQ